MNKKGFTLIELIVVVIVIGILATFAVPQYLKVVTRGKVAKAKNSLALIVRAEKMYRSKYDTYKACTNNADLVTAADSLSNQSEVGLNKLITDTDWTYTVPTGDVTTFIAQASGNTSDSAINAKIISVNEIGNWSIDATLPQD